MQSPDNDPRGLYYDFVDSRFPFRKFDGEQKSKATVV